MIRARFDGNGTSRQTLRDAAVRERTSTAASSCRLSRTFPFAAVRPARGVDTFRSGLVDLSLPLAEAAPEMTRRIRRPPARVLPDRRAALDDQTPVPHRHSLVPREPRAASPGTREPAIVRRRRR